MSFSYLLSDELAELYLNYKKGKKVNQTMLEALFSFYQPVPFISLDQFNKYGCDNVEARQALMASGYSTKSEAEVLDETKYKIILTTDCNDYPYVNINGGNLKKEIVVSYKVGEARDETIKHLKNLCKNAKRIIMCDNYMFNASDIKSTAISIFFDKILSRNKINVFYKIKKYEKNVQDNITYLKNLRPDCNIKPCNKNEYNGVHDRYLQIDNKLEVVLSSGFDYLFDTSKEISIIYREITN